jgi:putative flavoprotein involved in K+ transport
VGDGFPAGLPVARRARPRREGQLRHEEGVVGSPGLYALGLPVLRRRKSTFICGTKDDAREVIDHLMRYLAERRWS